MKHSIILAVVALASVPTLATAAPTPQKCVVQTDPQIAVLVKELMHEMDANRDALLTKQEMAAYAARHGGMIVINARHWKESDRNHDGSISAPEAEDVFRRINRLQCGKGR